MARTYRLSIGVLGLAAACGPSVGVEHEPSPEAVEYATKICGAIMACGCVERFSAAADCEDELIGRFDDVVSDGVEVDVACLAATLDGPGTTDCAKLSTGNETCTALVGTKQAGDACVGHPELLGVAVNECIEGLYCFHDDVCAATDPLPFDVEGGPCDPAVQRRCLSSSTVDLYCAPNGTCTHAIPEGEACDSAFACDSDVLDGTRGLYCDGFSHGSGTCAFQSLVGEPCDPLDAAPCGVNGEGEFEGLEGWCDPTSEICVADGPAICASADYPLAWP